MNLFEIIKNAPETSQLITDEKIQTTLSTYSHLYPDQSRKLADQLEKLAEADEN